MVGVGVRVLVTLNRPTQLILIRTCEYINRILLLFFSNQFFISALITESLLVTYKRTLSVLYLDNRTAFRSIARSKCDESIVDERHQEAYFFCSWHKFIRGKRISHFSKMNTNLINSTIRVEASFHSIRRITSVGRRKCSISGHL